VNRDETLEWLDVAIAAMSLGTEAAGVIGLRTIRIANGGPRAIDEAWRMCSEKILSVAQLQAKLLTRSSGEPLAASRIAVKHYRSKVAANRRRLTA